MNAPLFFLGCTGLVVCGVHLGWLMWGQDVKHLRADRAAWVRYADSLEADAESWRTVQAVANVADWHADTTSANGRLAELSSVPLPRSAPRLFSVDGGKR